jgi:hypothetical protein
MTKDELTNWALANGWRLIGGNPSLVKPTNPKDAIVRMVLKTTVAQVEIKKPSGKWEKVASESYTKIAYDAQAELPTGLGLATTSGLTMLMRDNKDRQVFAKLSKP